MNTSLVCLAADWHRLARKGLLWVIVGLGPGMVGTFGIIAVVFGQSLPGSDLTSATLFVLWFGFYFTLAGQGTQTLSYALPLPRVWWVLGPWFWLLFWLAAGFLTVFVPAGLLVVLAPGRVLPPTLADLGLPVLALLYLSAWIPLALDRGPQGLLSGYLLYWSVFLGWSLRTLPGLGAYRAFVDGLWSSGQPEIWALGCLVFGLSVWGSLRMARKKEF